MNVSSECRIDDPLSGVVNKILSEAGVDKVSCLYYIAYINLYIYSILQLIPFYLLCIARIHSDPPLVLELMYLRHQQMYLRHQQMSFRRKWVLMVCMTIAVRLLLGRRVRMWMKMMLQLLKFRYNALASFPLVC